MRSSSLTLAALFFAFVITSGSAVGQSADLSITKTDSPDPVPAGSNLTYQIGLINNGPATAQNVVLNDVLPVARGLWAEAERRCGDAERARELASEAAAQLDEGSPSLLNEAPVFLALHDACVDLGRLGEAKQAIARGVPRLVTRMRGLAGTPYARTFLTELAPNAGLLAAAEAYGLVPDAINAVIAEEAEAVAAPPIVDLPAEATVTILVD